MIAERRKYEVFISSTAEDLREVRDSLIGTTVQCGHFPSAMELFTSAGAKDIELIEDCIRRSDIYVILVGARYGSEVEGLEKSYTRVEYDLALKYKKPVLAFLMTDEEYHRERSELPDGDHERKHDDDLRDFRELVKQHPEGFGRIVQFFELDEGVSELSRKYQLALQDAIGSFRGKRGWIRGELYDELEGKIGLGDVAGQNPFFKRFITRLDSFDVLSLRCAEKVPHLKRAIAEYFSDQYLGRIIDSGFRNLFFESGSSIAFLSEVFIERLQEDWMREVSRDLRIQTNNVLTYLDFLLSERIQIELYPYGPPEAKYGATFGPLTAVPRREPPSRPRQLSEMGRRGVEGIRDRLIEGYQHCGLILMAASGLELSRESEFPGPHVGSYYNKLFKRAILASACPTVMFLDETKVPWEFKIGNCFPVCDKDMSWSSVCQTNPLAIAVAASTEEKVKELERLLGELTLCNLEIEYHDGTAYTVIASNDHFQDVLE